MPRHRFALERCHSCEEQGQVLAVALFLAQFVIPLCHGGQFAPRALVSGVPANAISAGCCCVKDTISDAAAVAAPMVGSGTTAVAAPMVASGTTAVAAPVVASGTTAVAAPMVALGATAVAAPVVASGTTAVAAPVVASGTPAVAAPVVASGATAVAAPVVASGVVSVAVPVVASGATAVAAFSAQGLRAVERIAVALSGAAVTTPLVMESTGVAGAFTVVVLGLDAASTARAGSTISVMLSAVMRPVSNWSRSAERSVPQTASANW